MNEFINYDKHTGLSINTYRNPDATLGDITDVVAAVKNGDESVCCDLDGALDALEDGTLWTDDDQETIEYIHDEIRRLS